ncbi:hypothetical protein [Caudovirales GX15bay]|nr:hypothetical protein [Caudovirales GX15bay]
MAKQAAAEKQTRTWAPGTKDEAARKRRQHRIVRQYLEMLPASGRGQARDAAAIQTDLDAVMAELANGVAGIDRLMLTQRRLDLEAELGEDGGPSIDELEQEFIAEAFEYAQRKGISRQAFREVGVPARVLRDAGL